MCIRDSRPARARAPSSGERRPSPRRQESPQGSKNRDKRRPKRGGANGRASATTSRPATATASPAR
eukprot:11202460-Alexandrium_andersonii.AAC.1